ncbi:hypothetical protein ACFVYG_38265 [Streptomyces sp. NPDC058256]|uniref:hypothetical protein n=1 Tax=Streptomyces sp. NPDC058256 TaxID=3346408 RepID=UPI0036E17803
MAGTAAIGAVVHLPATVIKEGRDLSSSMSGLLADTAYHLLPGLAALQVPAEETVPVLHLEPRGTGAPAHRLLSEPQSGPATKPPKKTEMSAMIQVMPGQTRSAPRTGLRARMRSRQAGAAYA